MSVQNDTDLGNLCLPLAGALGDSERDRMRRESPLIVVPARFSFWRSMLTMFSMVLQAMYEVTLFSSPRNSPRQAQRARQDLGQSFSHESSTRCAREERVGPRSASTRTRRGASARKTGQRAPVWDRKRAAAAGFLGHERRADQARGAGAASRWQRRGTRSSGRAATGSVDFASFTLSQIPSFLQSGFPPIHNT